MINIITHQEGALNLAPNQPGLEKRKIQNTLPRNGPVDQKGGKIQGGGGRGGGGGGGGEEEEEEVEVEEENGKLYENKE